MKIIRKHFVFYGRVQGVGFRKRAKQGALSFGVSGWVRNLSDGSVEMEAEGLEENIDKMLIHIEKGIFIRIDNLEIRSLTVKNTTGFEISD